MSLARIGSRGTATPGRPGPARYARPAMAGAPLDEVLPFALKVWNFMLGARMAMLVNIGDELGPYRAMHGAGPLYYESRR
jgi:hypothetical protein